MKLFPRSLSAVLSLTMGASLMMVALPPANAATATFVTPTGATTSGGPVDASATFTTGAGTLSITLIDLLANPKSVGQTLSDLIFTLSSHQTTGTISSSSGQLVTVAANGTATTGATTTTGWGLNSNVSGGIQLDALGFVGPAGLIIGPPGPGGIYTNANGSIAGNGPHNPFINQTATFLLSIAGLTAADTVTSALFSFGTEAGVERAGVPSAIPLPGALPLFATGLAGLGLIKWRKKRKAQAAAA
jgi:hypothetical protein